MSLNLNPPFDIKDTPAGQVPVFHGTNVKVHDFIGWVLVKRKTAGEFIERNSGLRRRCVQT